jgi:hypothetical protein
MLTQSCTGHRVPIHDQSPPGLQSELKGPTPQNEHLPTEDGGYQLYKPAGKLDGKRAIITGGDSGIGRAIAILFAMEGADSLITYLPEEASEEVSFVLDGLDETRELQGGGRQGARGHGWD